MVPDQWTFGTRNPKNRQICPKCSEVTLQLHTALRIWNHTGLSLNLNFHRSNWKCHPFLPASLKIKYIPVYVLKIDVFSLFLRSIDGSMVRPQSRLQLDLFLSWCRQSQSPRQVGETRRPDHTPTGPGASRNTSAQCSCQCLFNSASQLCLNNKLQRVGQSSACI